MPVPRQDSMGREPETLIDKIEKRLENSRYNIQMVDEKDTKLLRVWSLALIGLLLGLTVYQTILAAFTGSIIGDTIAGPTIYIVATVLADVNRLAVMGPSSDCRVECQLTRIAS